MRLVFVATHHKGHFRGEHKRGSLARKAKLVFEVAQKVAEIDVKQVTVASDHDVA